MATDAPHRARYPRLPPDTLSQVAAWLVVVVLLISVALRAAARFDVWYVARSIVPSDTRVLCPIDLATASNGGSYAGC
jgi:hypothetical protein